MTRLVYYVAASLDGYIATPDGGVAWLAPFESTTDDYGYAAFLESVSGLVMGRRTYEQVRSFGDWPYPGQPCRVVTSRPLVDAPDGVVASASPTEALATLPGRVWLVGGSRLFEACRAGGFVAEYVVAVVPVLLGDGVPLFRPGPGGPLHLRECRPFPNGIVQLRYTVEPREPGDGPPSGGPR